MGFTATLFLKGVTQKLERPQLGGFCGSVGSLRSLKMAIGSKGKSWVKPEAGSRRGICSRVPGQRQHKESEPKSAFEIWVKRQSPNQAKFEARSSGAGMVMGATEGPHCCFHYSYSDEGLMWCGIFIKI